MERLTKTWDDGTHGAADKLPCGENSHEYKRLVLEALGKYEDIGLLPEEVVGLVQREAEKESATYVVDAIGSEAKHIIDLLMVEASGRLVELPPTEKDFEAACEAVHNAWWDEKKRQGVKIHPDMIPYDELDESVKEYDRATVKAVLDALTGAAVK